MKEKRTTNSTMSIKKGMASMYLVVFVTMLTGIITLSFMRIMMSNTKGANSADLSQSAYDAAIAGVEDAKLALLYYHDCLSKEEFATPAERVQCETAINAMNNGANNGDCNTIAEVLGMTRSGNGETVLRADRDTTNPGGEDAYIDQAYTCVQISEELESYKATFDTSNNAQRIIPIRTADYEDVEGIIFTYSGTLDGNVNDMESSSDANTSDYNDLEEDITDSSDYFLPVVLFELFQTSDSFKLSELDLAEFNSTDHFMTMLYPKKSSSPPRNFISKEEALNYSKIDSSKTVSGKKAKDVECSISGKEYTCKVAIQFPDYSKADSSYNKLEGSFFIRLSLPYGNPAFDLDITLCTDMNDQGYCTDNLIGASDDKTTKFTGVQAEIDSTGRAGTFFRRVIARVELVDVNFVYPEYGLQVVGEKDESRIDKNYWVTAERCQYANDGEVKTCEKTADIYDGRF